MRSVSTVSLENDRNCITAFILAAYTADATGADGWWMQFLAKRNWIHLFIHKTCWCRVETNRDFNALSSCNAARSETLLTRHTRQNLGCNRQSLPGTLLVNVCFYSKASQQVFAKHCVQRYWPQPSPYLRYIGNDIYTNMYPIVQRWLMPMQKLFSYCHRCCLELISMRWWMK